MRTYNDMIEDLGDSILEDYKQKFRDMGIDEKYVHTYAIDLMYEKGS